MQHQNQPPVPGFSFAGALFGFPAAEGCAEPGEHAPDSWKRDFEDKSFPDAELCQLLALSCKPGRDWLHQAAPRLTASLDVSLGPRAFDRRQWAVSDVIEQRSPKETVLLLTADTHPIPVQRGEDQKRVLDQRQSNLRRSRASYQLSAAYKAVKQLRISKTIRRGDPALPLFLPRLCGVTQLRLDCELTDALLRLLLDHLPLLDSLKVKYVWGVSPALAGRQCQWTRLALTGDNGPPEAGDLANLPLPSNGRELRVKVPKDTEFVIELDPEGIPEPVLQRLGRWEVQAGSIHLVPRGWYRLQNLPGANGLYLALQQIADNPPDAGQLPLVLGCWHIVPAFLPFLSILTERPVQLCGTCVWQQPPQTAIARQLPNITSLDIRDYSLTDELLTVLLVHCYGLQHLCVDRLALERSHTHWQAGRWQHIRVITGEIDLGQLGKLPQAQQGSFCVRRSHEDPWEPCVWSVCVYPSMTVASGMAFDGLNINPPPLVRVPTTLHDEWHGHEPAPVRSALMRLTATPTLPAADQAAALQSALDRAAAQDADSQRLHLHLTGFTLGPELERVLADAKAGGRDMRVSMMGGRCSRRGLALAAPLPAFTRLELVGMCDEHTAAGATAAIAAATAAAAAGTAVAAVTATATAAATTTAAATAAAANAAGQQAQPAAALAAAQQAQPAAGALAWPAGEAAGQWVVSVRQLFGLLHRAGGAESVMLDNCVLCFDLAGTEEFVPWTKASTQGAGRPIQTTQPVTGSILTTLGEALQVKHSKPGVMTYEVRSPSPHMDVLRQGLAIQASNRVLAALPIPQVLEYMGDWDVAIVADKSITPIQASQAVVFGPDIIWPEPGTKDAARVCQRLGQMLPCGIRADVVLHDTCGISNLAHVLLGWGFRSKRRVHVVKEDDSFVESLQTEYSLRLGAPACLSGVVQQWREPPSPISPELIASTAQLARKAHVLRCHQAASEGVKVLAGLKEEAEKAEDEERPHDEARILQLCPLVENMTEQAIMAGKTAEQGGPMLEIAWELPARVWGEVVLSLRAVEHAADQPAV